MTKFIFPLSVFMAHKFVQVLAKWRLNFTFPLKKIKYK